MDDNLDINKAFDSLVSQLQDLDEVEDDSITLADINECIMRMNECSMYLARFISTALSAPEDEPIPAPDAVVQLLPQTMVYAYRLSVSLHDMLCDDCFKHCGCTGEETCEVCRSDTD